MVFGSGGWSRSTGPVAPSIPQPWSEGARGRDHELLLLAEVEERRAEVRRSHRRRHGGAEDLGGGGRLDPGDLERHLAADVGPDHDQPFSTRLPAPGDAGVHGDRLPLHLDRGGDGGGPRPAGRRLEGGGEAAGVVHRHRARRERPAAAGAGERHGGARHGQAVEPERAGERDLGAREDRPGGAAQVERRRGAHHQALGGVVRLGRGAAWRWSPPRRPGRARPRCRRPAPRRPRRPSR